MNSDDNKRIILEGAEARVAIRNAIAKVGNIVSATLGPAGRNVILDRARRDRSPLITNDGVSIAEEIRMDNECEDLVVQTVIETAKRTNDEAGDGTTTSITIARQLIEDCLEKIGDDDLTGIPGSENPMQIARQIEKEKNIVIEELKAMATPVETLEKLKDVTFSSLEDREVGDIVAEAVFEVGKEGFTTLETGYDGKVERETVKGMKVYAKYVAPFMVTNNKKQAVYTKAPILVSNLTFSSLATLQPLINDMQKQAPGEHNAFVIIGTKFEAPAIQAAWNIFEKTRDKVPFRILLVKAPSLTDEEMEDVASFLDARFINSDTKIGMKAESIKYKDMGHADKIIVGDDETVIIGGRGLETRVTEDAMGTRVDERIEKIKADLKLEKDDIFIKKMERRLGILSGGISVIKVGAKTDTERSYLRLKVEDAINAAKAALQEGVVKGGGLTLKEIADNHEDFLIAGALYAPYQQIIKNAGGELEITDDIIDPVKVTRSALENAVSMAKILITTQTIIAEKKESMVEQLKEIIG